ncbi:histidine kinase [Actinoplanes sp. NPDC051633]|uniref:sensor histidine kinase n=1 Tax=Actinoplanes sp. NPDC051633 TaxID=3155670 RepID=UPI0034210864
MDVLGGLRHRPVFRPHLADLVMALIVLLATLLTTTAPDHLRDAPALSAATIACGALLLRHRLPYVALAVSTVAAEVYLARYQNLNGTLILAAPLVALYTVAEQSARRWALLAGGVLVLAVGTVHTVGVPSRVLGPENLALTALGGLAVAAGTAARHRRAYLAEVERRARDAERDRDTETRRRLTEERLRIARDLHDSVGHHLALITVQAAAADHTAADADPGIHRTLTEIRESSKAALEQLRESVGLLRQPGEDPAPREPVAGLADLDDLLGSFRRAGLDVSCHVDTSDRHLPWVVDHTAYRIVQEALTNVRKHAGPVAVTLTVRHDPEAVTVIVDNEGPVGPAGDGHGITGMRERVAALGGTLLARPRPDGGFRVAAVIPVTA